ncbi:hypothetical protein CONPUDRAFT_63485, partial [Coniophora puteana RWD-64-598 SS2]
QSVLHLLNDDFNGCHELAQMSESNPYSNNLHHIVHRREPDYWNSRWWADRLSHPHLAQIYVPGDASATEKDGRTAARDFVNEVERFSTSRQKKSSEQLAALEKRQWEEMTTLAKIIIAMEN